MKLNSGKNKIHIAVCDDSDADLQEILYYTKEYLTKKGVQNDSITQFSEGKKLLEAIGQGEKFDLLILDVMMGELDGITLAKSIREMRLKCDILYVSSNREMAMQGYEVEAVRYLGKPIEREKFEEAMALCIRKIEKRNHKFIVPVEEGSALFLQEQIYYIEACGAYVKIVEREKETMAHIRISQVETMVEADTFLQCHRGFLINMKHIRCVRSQELELSNGAVIPVSKHRIKEVKNKLMQYLEE